MTNLIKKPEALPSTPSAAEIAEKSEIVVNVSLGDLMASVADGKVSSTVINEEANKVIALALAKIPEFLSYEENIMQIIKSLIENVLILNIEQTSQILGVSKNTIRSRFTPKSKYHDPTFPRLLDIGMGDKEKSRKGFRYKELKIWIDSLQKQSYPFHGDTENAIKKGDK